MKPRWHAFGHIALELSAKLRMCMHNLIRFLNKTDKGNLKSKMLPACIDCITGRNQINIIK